MLGGARATRGAGAEETRETEVRMAKMVDFMVSLGMIKVDDEIGTADTSIGAPAAIVDISFSTHPEKGGVGLMYLGRNF